jgi:hypothetical protein
MTKFLLDSNAVILSATSDKEVKPADVSINALMDDGVAHNPSATLEPSLGGSTIVSIASPMINSANDPQGILRMAKKVANVQSLLPAKIVDIEAKISLRTDLRSSNPQYVSVLHNMMGRCNDIIMI